MGKEDLRCLVSKHWILFQNWNRQWKNDGRAQIFFSHLQIWSQFGKHRWYRNPNACGKFCLDEQCFLQVMRYFSSNEQSLFTFRSFSYGTPIWYCDIAWSAVDIMRDFCHSTWLILWYRYMLWLTITTINKVWKPVKLNACIIIFNLSTRSFLHSLIYD